MSYRVFLWHVHLIRDVDVDVSCVFFLRWGQRLRDVHVIHSVSYWYVFVASGSV